jgi:hypothetical protein
MNADTDSIACTIKNYNLFNGLSSKFFKAIHSEDKEGQGVPLVEGAEMFHV